MTTAAQPFVVTFDIPSNRYNDLLAYLSTELGDTQVSLHELPGKEAGRTGYFLAVKDIEPSLFSNLTAGFQSQFDAVLHTDFLTTSDNKIRHTSMQLNGKLPNKVAAASKIAKRRPDYVL